MFPETIFQDRKTGVAVIRLSNGDIALRVNKGWDDRRYARIYRKFNCTRVWIYARDGSDALDGFLRAQLSPKLQLMGSFKNVRLVEQATFLESLMIELTDHAKLDLSKLLLKEFRGSLAATTGVAHLPTPLTTVALWGYKGQDMVDLSYLKNLETLGLNLARNLASLKGIEGFSNLRTLEIWSAPHLADLELLTKLAKLQELRFEHIKGFDDISALGRLFYLRKLVINSCGKLPSLKVLTGLPSLEELHFIESTNIEDGAILQLREIPTLRKVWFQNRRHYDVTREELMDMLTK